MNGIEWTDYILQPAPQNLLCLFRRPAWGNNILAYARDFHPECNAVDLQWMLTGIAREQLERMSPECRLQVMPELGVFSQWAWALTDRYSRTAAQVLWSGMRGVSQSTQEQRDAAFGEHTSENARSLLGL